MTLLAHLVVLVNMKTLAVTNQVRPGQIVYGAKGPFVLD